MLKVHSRNRSQHIGVSASGAHRSLNAWPCRVWPQLLAKIPRINWSHGSHCGCEVLAVVADKNVQVLCDSVGRVEANGSAANDQEAYVLFCQGTYEFVLLLIEIDGPRHEPSLAGPCLQSDTEFFQERFRTVP